jgi:hypothetical protein
MNKLPVKELHRPVMIFFLGWLAPLVIITYVPGGEFFYSSLVYWLASVTFLALALGAIQLTLSTLRNSGLNTEGKRSQAARLTMEEYCRSLTLLLMGIAILSLLPGEQPTYMTDLLLYVSLRLGVCLLFLGGLVFAVTHVGLRKLGGSK